MTKRVLFGGIIGLTLLAGVLLLMGGPQQSLRSLRDARALAALPQVSVASLLQLENSAPDVVVFQDGGEGWFELDINALPADTQIGFHTGRMIDLFASGDHVPVYCSNQSAKVLWTVRDAHIAEDYAFCNPRRMDLGPLHAFSTAVEMIEQDLSRDAVLELSADVAADPTRAMVSGPRSMVPYTQRYILTPPLMWYLDGQTPRRHEVEDAIETRIIAHLGQAQMAFRRRPNSNPNLTYRGADGQGVPVSGMAIAHNGTTGILPGVWGEPYEIWVDCVPEACANIATLDLGELFDGGRDLAGLRGALRHMVETPNPEGTPTPLDWYPTLAELEADAVRIAEPIEITYQTRYIQRP
ncbi:hypothetical protein [Gymnodinialimonas sp. 57CJ19]|uniref:hypothetical protein n=1 Tax=Gymnodinialimonas sp. 57CJ19 TaxID=3138498 RepID=UPI0031344CB8